MNIERPTLKGRLGVVAVLPALALLGCGTPGRPGTEKAPEAETRLSPEEVKTFYNDAQDPRVFGITPLRTPSGAQFVGNHHRVQGGERLVLAFEKVADGAAPLPLISIQGWNRDKWPALIDTASAESWIAFPAALTMKLRPLAPPGFVIQPVHVADSANGYLCLADTLRLGDAIVNNSLFFARGARPGLGPLARGIGDPPPVMVLGMRFLEAFGIVQLDFPGRAARLSTFSSYAPDPARLRAALPYRIDDGVPVIEGRMDGERVDFCIDSAGTFAVAIVGGDEPGAAAVAVELGDWRVDGVEVTGVTIEEGGTLRPARLGAGLLARYVVTLVTADKRVIFEAAH